MAGADLQLAGPPLTGERDARGCRGRRRSCRGGGSENAPRRDASAGSGGEADDATPSAFQRGDLGSESRLPNKRLARSRPRFVHTAARTGCPACPRLSHADRFLTPVLKRDASALATPVHRCPEWGSLVRAQYRPSGKAPHSGAFLFSAEQPTQMAFPVVGSTRLWFVLTWASERVC
jgi:hypothetical protein